MVIQKAANKKADILVLYPSITKIGAASSNIIVGVNKIPGTL